MHALASHRPTRSALARPVANSERVELRCFAILARRGSFRRVAQELTISQPAPSRQIRKLEDGPGTQRPVRHTRGVTLTPAGVCLLDRLDTIMHLLAAPLQQADNEAVHGTMSLAMPAELAPLLVPLLVAAFHATCPRVTLDVTLEAWLRSMAIRDELARGTLVFRPIEQPTLCATHAIAVRQTTTEPQLRGFVDVVRDVVMALAKDGTWKGARIARPEANDSIAISASDLAPWRVSAADPAFRTLQPVSD